MPDDIDEETRPLVAELRRRLGERLPADYDTEFNLQRWLINAKNVCRLSGRKLLDHVEKKLLHHLRYRRAWRFDRAEPPDIDQNPMFRRGISPRGHLHYLPSCHRFLWWLDYSSLDTVGVLSSFTSSDILTWNLHFYEHALRVVNRKERETGRRSGVIIIMDVQNYQMNPWTIMFSTNGQLGHLVQMFAYDHYPDLVYPYHVINVPAWLNLPVKLLRMALPKDFNDRFRLHGSNFSSQLLKDIPYHELPRQLGGDSPDSDALEPIPSRKIDPSEYYQPKSNNEQSQSNAVHLQLQPGKRRSVPVDCTSSALLSWTFTTDADVQFGIFFQPTGQRLEQSDGDDVLDQLDMVHPYLRLGAKLVPEQGELLCEESGLYHFVFANKNSWITRRNIHLKVRLDGELLDRKLLSEASLQL